MDDRSKVRSETAREHDDGPLIDSVEQTPSQEGRSGGNLQTDVGTQASLERVRDPDAREGVDKEDKINHAQETSTNHPADAAG